MTTPNLGVFVFALVFFLFMQTLDIHMPLFSHSSIEQCIFSEVSVVLTARSYVHFALSVLFSPGINTCSYKIEFTDFMRIISRFFFLRLLLSGGAPLSPDTHDFVRNALTLPLVGGYGLTESCACGTIMEKDESSTGRVGPPLQGVQVRLVNWDEGNYKVTDEPRPRGNLISDLNSNSNFS